MKHLLFLLFIPLVFFTVCSDGDKPAINGMWQLKTIENGLHVQPVDTVFYSFQRQSIFSYTLLQEKESLPATYTVIYGFIDFPDDNHLHIRLDKNHYRQASCVLWKDTSVVYDIIRLDAKYLTLSQNGIFYHFNKY